MSSLFPLKYVAKIGHCVPSTPFYKQSSRKTATVSPVIDAHSLLEKTNDN